MYQRMACISGGTDGALERCRLQLTLKQVIEAKYGAPVYSLHPPMVATFPDAPLESSPVHHRVCSQQ